MKTMLHHESVAMTERYLGVHPERERRDSRITGREMFPKVVEAQVVSLEAWRK